MNDEQLLDLVESAVRQHILPILREAMSTCVERHSIGQGRGSDGYSFGTDAWSFPKRLFLDAAADEESGFPFRVDCSSGCVLQYDGLRLRHHSVGHSENEPIDEARPRAANALCSETAQLDLFQPERTHRALSDRCIVIAYMANPSEGLCAVYLCTVDHVDEHGKIAAWAATRELWRLSDQYSALTPATEQVPLVSTPEPVVTRRRPPSIEDGPAHETDEGDAWSHLEDVPTPEVTRNKPAEPSIKDEDS